MPKNTIPSDTLRTWKWSPTSQTIFPVHVPSDTSRTWKSAPTQNYFQTLTHMGLTIHKYNHFDKNKHVFAKRICNFSTKESACGRLFNRKQLLGLPIQTKMSLETYDISYNTTFVLERALYKEIYLPCCYPPCH